MKVQRNKVRYYMYSGFLVSLHIVCYLIFLENRFQYEASFNNTMLSLPVAVCSLLQNLPKSIKLKHFSNLKVTSFI